MAMSNLTDVVILTDNYSSRNGRTIDTITIHHMAGNLSVETCGQVFRDREASANYGIGTDGRVGCYVDEDNRAWSTTNWDNDTRAINIEVANDEIGGNWHVSDTALNKCIDLCVDICKRYGFRASYDGTPGCHFTTHNMFMATTCPGPYLESKMPYIVEEVNRRLDGPSPEPTPTPTPTPGGNFNIGDRVLVTGVLTEDSTGCGGQTLPYTGNPDDPTDIKYITLINDGAVRPYHLSNGPEQGMEDIGWASADQLKKY